MNGRHETEQTRRRLWGVPLGALIAILGASVAVAAIWFAMTDITGQVATRSFGAALTEAPTVEAGTCTVPSWDADGFDLQFGNAMQLDACTVGFNAKATTAHIPVLQDFLFAGSAGMVDVTGTGVCGLELPAVPGPLGDFELTFTVTEAAPANTTIAFAAGDGIEWVLFPDYLLANCSL